MKTIIIAVAAIILTASYSAASTITCDMVGNKMVCSSDDPTDNFTINTNDDEAKEYKIKTLVKKIARDTMEKAGFKKLKIEYVKASGSGRYLLVGITGKKGASYTCKAIKNGQVIAIDNGYLHGSSFEAMITGAGSADSASCRYNI